MKKTVGFKIRRARKALGLSQLDLFFETGIHQSVICLYEQDKRLPQLKDIRRLASVLHLNVEELIP